MFDVFENQKETLIFSKDRIICTMLNRKRNEQLLRSIPYTTFHDMAIIYRYLVGETQKGLCTSIITNKMMIEHGLDKETIQSCAMKNTARLYPIKMEPLSDTLASLFSSGFTNQEKELLPFLKTEKGQEETIPMYVLTNQSGILGATVMNYPDMLEYLADRLQSSLIVIPSSIHEVLVIKADISLEKATHMLREVNSSCVDDNEILSDNAIYYVWSKEREGRTYENTCL